MGLQIRRLRRFGLASLLIAGALVLMSTITVLLGLRNLASSREAVDETNFVLRNMAELQADMRRAETGQRGYLLTGERRYLLPYEEARRQIPEDLAQLASLALDDNQRRSVRAMQPIIAAKLEELAQTVNLRQQSLDAALRVVRTGRGQSLMEAFETGAQRFVIAEQGQLGRHLAAEQQIARMTAAAAALTGLLALLCALAGFFLIFQQRQAEALLRYNLELEDKVEERTRRLSEANRELDAYAYTISHDLRAPLRAMHGYADALEEDYGAVLPEQGRKFASAIVSAADRMNALIEDMLSYARISREELALQPVSLDKLGERLLRDRDDSASIEVVGRLGVVLANATVLQQVLENLISNAVKFVRPGEAPRVRIRSERRGDRLRLWVEDNGIGVDSEHQQRIFEPFERLHGVESYPGTGIGLAIVRRAVERMGGTCGVESMPDEGSRFWIELQRGAEESMG